MIVYAASRRTQFAPRLLLFVTALLCPVSFLQWISMGFFIENCRKNDTERVREVTICTALCTKMPRAMPA